MIYPDCYRLPKIVQRVCILQFPEQMIQPNRNETIEAQQPNHILRHGVVKVKGRILYKVFVVIS